jgi:magnesium chelatase subunit I
LPHRRRRGFGAGVTYADFDQDDRVGVVASAVGFETDFRTMRTLFYTVLNTFNRYFNIHEFDELIRRFDEGLTIETGDMVPSKNLANWMKDVPSLKNAGARLAVGKTRSAQASAVEFVLEGLHLNRRLNKDRREGGYRYRG